MKKMYFSLPMLAIGLSAMAQTTAPTPPTAEPEKPSAKITGFIRYEAIYDSYKSTETRDGESYSFPLRESLDSFGNDLNKVNQLQMLGLQSRLRTTINGGNAFGAKTSGIIEGDFNGSGDTYKFHFALRIAMLKLDWENSQLLLGQWWHPITISEFGANTVAFGAGIPFASLNRCAQVRYTYKVAPKLKLLGALCSYTTHRPIEYSTVNSQRSSGLPDLEFQLQYGDVKEFFASVTGGYKWLKPLLSYTDSLNKISQSTKNIGSYHLQGSLGYQLPFLSVKAQCIYGQNLTFLSLIGGYSPLFSSKGASELDYDNMKTVSLWSDFETKGDKVKLGLFAGYSENLGTSKTVTIDKSLVREKDLRKIFRIAPRVYFINGPVDIGVEYTITGATYGTFDGKIASNIVKPVINNRVHVAVRYTF